MQSVVRRVAGCTVPSLRTVSRVSSTRCFSSQNSEEVKRTKASSGRTAVRYRARVSEDAPLTNSGRVLFPPRKPVASDSAPTVTDTLPPKQRRARKRAEQAAAEAGVIELKQDFSRSGSGFTARFSRQDTAALALSSLLSRNQRRYFGINQIVSILHSNQCTDLAVYDVHAAMTYCDYLVTDTASPDLWCSRVIVA